MANGSVVTCPQCADPYAAPTNPAWQVRVGAAFLGLHVAIVVASVALRWHQRRSRMLMARDRSMEVVTFIGAAASLHWSLRDVLGDGNWPCLAYWPLSVCVSACFMVPIIVRMYRIAAMHFAQDRVVRALQAQAAAGGGSDSATPPAATSGDAQSPPPEAVKLAAPDAGAPATSAAPPPDGASAAPTFAADGSSGATPAATEAGTPLPPAALAALSFPPRSTAGGRAVEYIMLDVLRMHTARSEVIMLAVIEASVVVSNVYRAVVDTNLRPGITGCVLGPSDTWLGSVLYMLFFLTFVGWAPAMLWRRDAFYMREEYMAFLIVGLCLSPFFLGPRLTGGREIAPYANTIMPTARTVNMLAWTHCIMAHIVPSLVSLARERKMARRVAPAPAGVTVTDADSASQLSLAQEPPAAAAAARLDGAADSRRPSIGDIELQRALHVTPLPSQTDAVVVVSPDGGGGGGGDGDGDDDGDDDDNGDVGGQLGGSRVEHPSRPTAGAARTLSGRTTGRAPAAPTLSAAAAQGQERRSPQAMLLFTVSCAAVSVRGVPLAVRNWNELMAVCTRAVAKRVEHMTAQDHRVVTAVFIATPLCDTWLRPALQREMASEALLFIGDCFAFRAVASRLSLTVQRLLSTPAPPPISVKAAPRLAPIVEADSDVQPSWMEGSSLAVGAPADGGASGGASRLSPPASPVPLSAPSVAAVRHEVVAALSGVIAQERQMLFRYLSPFSPMRIALAPATEADLRTRVTAMKNRVSLLGSASRLHFRGMDAAAVAAMLSDVRRTFDLAAAEALSNMAEGAMYRLLASPDGDRALRAAADLLATPDYVGGGALGAALAGTRPPRRPPAADAAGADA